jgi:trehalose 6-phosphate phosphatase
MVELGTAVARDGWRALLDGRSRALVALDFDGTLSPIVADPARSALAAGAAEALAGLADVAGCVAIVTGRQAAVVVALAGLAPTDRVLVEGQYGAEQWRAGNLTVAEPAPGVAAVRAALPGVLAGADPATWVEDKGSSLVVHTRRAARPGDELSALTPVLAELAAHNGLDAHVGRNVVEIRPRGYDKGGALRRLVEQCDPSAVLYAGDDLGDLPAFAAVAELRTAGLPGLSVCAGSTEAHEVAEQADLVVDGPSGVVELLAEVARG